MNIGSILLIVVVIAGSAGQAQDNPDPSSIDAMLLNDFFFYDGICKGGFGETNKACGASDYAGFLLGRLNWCWGREGEAYVEHTWHQCEFTSMSFSRPQEGWPGYGSN